MALPLLDRVTSRFRQFRRTDIRVASLTDLPQVTSAQELLTAETDAIWVLGGQATPSGGDWWSPFDAPYVLSLRNAVFYPCHSLPEQPSEPGHTGVERRHRMSGLLLREDGSILPDGLGKSFWLPHCLKAENMAGPWQADLPRRIRTVRGTHLFAEMFFGHFGHCLVDNPARLWPLATGILEKDMVESIIGQGVMGAGPYGQTLSPTADRLLTAFGAAAPARRVTADPLRLERLIIPRRIAPYQARMYPAFRQVLRQAGQTLSADEDLTGLPKRIWLSRMKLKHKRRPFTGGERLEQIMSDEFGFTVLHPETLPLSRQIAHARAATHIAGPVGSQLHLCGFSHRPGLKLLTVEPKFFRKGHTGINGNLIADIGTETVYAIDAEHPAGIPKQQVRWSFDQRHEAGLRSLVEAWI